MEPTINKLDSKVLEIVKTVIQRDQYSYDFILNKIQELTEQLAFFENLKTEADKLDLTR